MELKLGVFSTRFCGSLELSLGASRPKFLIATVRGETRGVVGGAGGQPQFVECFP